MNPEVFITYPELTNHGVPKYSRKHLLQMMRTGDFPQSVQLSPNRVAWRKSDLDRWAASRPVARVLTVGDTRQHPGRPVGSHVVVDDDGRRRVVSPEAA